MNFYVIDYLIKKARAYESGLYTMKNNVYKIYFWYLDKNGEEKEIVFCVKYWWQMALVRWRLKKAIAKNGYVDLNLF